MCIRDRADNVHGGRLPHHVRVLWDEAANTGQVPGLEKLVAVIRSREVSLVPVSYTHLDVYKRQQQIRLLFIRQMRLLL